MKKVINGKIYDTRTATFIHEYWNGLSTRDFNYCREQLYRKKTGEFFVYGDGGALTRWGTKYGNGYCDGADILPRTNEQALKWAENHEMEADEIIELFDISEE
jgi:hypothetical protein|tara:strand:+ start:644 stop:952 length:309 start_codon:yes stop_codon:yes gene_type:complete